MDPKDFNFDILFELFDTLIFFLTLITLNYDSKNPMKSRNIQVIIEIYTVLYSLYLYL